MSKTIKKIVALICSIATVASIASVGVSAFCTRGYGDYDVKITPAQPVLWWGYNDSATAYITKCNCDLVKNNLMVWIQVQYKDGDSYEMLPETGYYYDHQVNCGEARKTVEHESITYAYARFYATCGNSNIKDDPKFINDKSDTN